MASDPTRPQPGLPDWLLPVLYPRLPPRIFFVNSDPDRLNLIELINKANATNDLDEAVDILLPALGGTRAELRAKLGAANKWIDKNDLNDSTPEDTANDINDTVNGETDNLGQIVGELDTIIGDYIGSAVRDLRGTIGQITGEIVGDIVANQDRTADIIGGVLGTIIRGIDEQKGVLGSILDIVSGSIDIEITNEIIIPDEVFETVFIGILDVLTAQQSFMDGIFGTLMDGVVQIFTDIIEKEEPELIDIAVAIRESAVTEETSDKALLEQVEQINDPTLEGTGASVFDSVIEASRVIARDGDVPSWGDLFKGFDDQVFDECGTKPDDSEQAKEFYSVGVLPRGLIEKIFNYVAAVEDTGNITGVTLEKLWYSLGKAQGGLAITGAMAARELYEFARCVPYEIFEPGDAVVAFQRNLISRDQLQTDLKMRGYNDTRADILTEIGYQVPDISSLYSMNLRGLAAGANLTDRFQDLGYNPSDAEALADLKFYIPPAQDLITMAVREVFDPEIVAKFGQDQDFPEQFAEYAEQQGISRFWAEKYWQAHWVLPSVQMGFEMLHRRVIDEATLRQLLAAQDVMPGWRDALIAISYKPYTRVDIRRMHDVGVLNEAEVFEAYQDIGYDREKARTLTDFTLELNSDDPEDVEPLEGLTRSSIIAAYKDGIVDRVTADQLLTEEGIGESARLIYLTDAELEIERDMRKEVTQTILVEYENGASNLSEAVAELNTLPLTPLEREKAELKLRRLTAKKTKLPSKADLSKFYKLDIIGKGTFKDQLERLGYPDKWIDDYIELVKEGKLPDDEPTI